VTISLTFVSRLIFMSPSGTESQFRGSPLERQ
jgi:hypothetical protein